MARFAYAVPFCDRQRPRVYDVRPLRFLQMTRWIAVTLAARNGLRCEWRIELTVLRSRNRPRASCMAKETFRRYRTVEIRGFVIEITRRHVPCPAVAIPRQR